MSWLYSQYLIFHWKLLVLVSRIQKTGTGDNNFGKWKGTVSVRPTEMTRPVTVDPFKACPEYSDRTKPKWSVPFDVPTKFPEVGVEWKAPLEHRGPMEWGEEEGYV